jgi:hypothetical protein
LTFDQELDPQGLPLKVRPKDDVSGEAWFNFSNDLKCVDFKLSVFCAFGKENPNERITQGHIHVGRSYQNGPIAVTLYHVAELNQKGKKANGLIAEGRIANKDITPVTGADGERIVNVASLFDAFRRGQAYVNVHGSSFSNCHPSFAGGIARGQVFANSTTA